MRLINQRAGKTQNPGGCVPVGSGFFLAWSWDAPFVFTAQRYAETKDPRIVWEGHKAGRDIGYCHLEKLHNLEVLPPDGFMVACFPVKIRRASAGWTRAVAILDQVLL